MIQNNIFKIINLFVLVLFFNFSYSQKRSKKTNFNIEFDKMWIHGLLHLLGYNHIKLKDIYSRVASLLGKAVGRKLSTVECCLLIDEAAVTIVAGNIRRSAGMRQFASDDIEAASAKENLWS